MKPSKSTELTAAQKKALTEKMKKAGTYSKAYEDMGFMSRKDLRPVRLQLELLKPDVILREHKIRSTIVAFGSARVSSPDDAKANLAQCFRDAGARPGPLAVSPTGGLVPVKANAAPASVISCSRIGV